MYLYLSYIRLLIYLVIVKIFPQLSIHQSTNPMVYIPTDIPFINLPVYLIIIMKSTDRLMNGMSSGGLADGCMNVIILSFPDARYLNTHLYKKKKKKKDLPSYYFQCSELTFCVDSNSLSVPLRC